MGLVQFISQKIIEQKKEKAIIVAFDGVDTSGKTTLADKVDIELKQKGYNSIRVSIDKFHNSKKIRTRKGKYSPEGYFEDSFNLESIIECVIKPVKNGSAHIIKGIYDYRVENEVAVEKVEIDNTSILLFDGIFMNRDELYEYWDLSIFLDVDFETVIIRALKRDIVLFGSKDEVIKRYSERYIPGEKIYLEKCKPMSRADIVIENNDYSNPIIKKFG